MGEIAVELSNVSLSSPTGEGIVDDVSWVVPRNSTASVIGASGSGKSSLLRLINRLDDVSSGSIRVLGRSIEEWLPRELRRTVVWLPQAPHIGEQSARDVLAVPARLGLISEDEARERQPEALALSHFDDALLDRDSKRLSGGERQRLSLARALLLQPEVLLLDEPTSSLDGETATKVLAALERWRASREATLIVVTHRISDVRRLGGSLLMLDGGRVLHRGQTAEILESKAGDDLRRILAGEDVP